MAYGRSYGNPYNMVPQAINSVSNNLNSLIALNIAQKTAEGDLNLRMKKMDLDERLSLAKLQTQGKQQDAENARLSETLRFRDAQEQTDIGQFDKNYKLDQQKMNLNSLNSQSRRDADQSRIKTDELKRSQIQSEMAYKEQQNKPMTFKDYISNNVLMQTGAGKKLLNMLPPDLLNSSAPRSEWDQQFGAIVEKHPGVINKMLVESGNEKLKGVMVEAETALKDGDRPAYEALIQKGKQLAEQMNISASTLSPPSDKDIASVYNAALKESGGDPEIANNAVSTFVEARKKILATTNIPTAVKDFNEIVSTNARAGLKATINEYEKATGKKYIPDEEDKGYYSKGDYGPIRTRLAKEMLQAKPATGGKPEQSPVKTPEYNPAIGSVSKDAAILRDIAKGAGNWGLGKLKQAGNIQEPY